MLTPRGSAPEKICVILSICGIVTRATVRLTCRACSRIVTAFPAVRLRRHSPLRVVWLFRPDLRFTCGGDILYSVRRKVNRKKNNAEQGPQSILMSQIDRAAIRKQFQRHERDTGSSEVQIAVLTKEIEMLTEHLKANKKDHSSRYGLIRKVNTRRSLLDYLKREDEAVYQKIIKELGLRR